VPEIPQPTQDQKLDEKTLNVLINAMHELDVRIVGLNRDGCHCGLVARVALNALNPDKIREAAYRAGREDAAREQKQDRIDEQWSVWLTMPGGVTVVTLADEQDEEPLNALGDVRRYDSDEEWARDYAANPPAGTLKAQVRCRTRTHWSAWEPVDQPGVQPAICNPPGFSRGDHDRYHPEEKR
jgi:hypothetical protein